MKAALLTIVLSLLLATQGFSQIHEKDLIGTWFPVMEQFSNGDTSSILNPMLHTYESNGRGKFEIPGNNAKSFAIDYQLIGDSLIIKTSDNTLRGRILLLSKDYLQLSFDSTRIESFIPLPNHDTGESLKKINDAINNGIWQFEIQRPQVNDTFYVNYHFIDSLKDVAIILPEFRASNFNAWSSTHLPYDTESTVWSIGKHNQTSILHLLSIYSDDHTANYIIKSFESEKIEMELWDSGRKSTVVASKIHGPTKKDQIRILKNIIGKKWRLEKELAKDSILLDGSELMHSGTISSFFSQELYVHDSTALIDQQDIESKSLYLEFNPDHTYAIYRDERLLDKGTWISTFQGLELRLISSRRRSFGDGVYGGIISISKSKTSTLTLTRKFQHQLNNAGSIEFSNWETYKPYRKQK